MVFGRMEMKRGLENGMERHVDLKHNNKSTIWVRGKSTIGVRGKNTIGLAVRSQEVEIM